MNGIEVFLLASACTFVISVIALILTNNSGFIQTGLVLLVSFSPMINIVVFVVSVIIIYNHFIPKELR